MPNWLEEFHISKYTKKYDARTEGRYLNPPKLSHKFQVGEAVRVTPQGRFRIYVEKKNFGKRGIITEIGDYDHPIKGRLCTVKFHEGSLKFDEINLRLLTYELNMTYINGKED